MEVGQGVRLRGVFINYGAKNRENKDILDVSQR